MVKKVALALAAAMAVAAAALSLLTLLMVRRLPKPGRVSLDGVTTIDDAVEACRRSGLQGWALIAYAQQLVARKFTYSRLNTWDIPSRAFERGMGYCEQQALALKRIYDRLGIACTPVFSLGCVFPPKLVDGAPWPGGRTGHAWLRVTLGGEARDVCPSSVANRPGVTQFKVVSRVHHWYHWLRPFTHLGSSIENIRRDIIAQHALAKATRAQATHAPRAAVVARGGSEP
jgi:transglutaminase-like putative cysteine protease